MTDIMKITAHNSDDCLESNYQDSSTYQKRQYLAKFSRQYLAKFSRQLSENGRDKQHITTNVPICMYYNALSVTLLSIYEQPNAMSIVPSQYFPSNSPV